MFVIEMKDAANKRVSAQIERKCGRAPHTPTINQHSASLHVD
jgi:hypothetical protein